MNYISLEHFDPENEIENQYGKTSEFDAFEFWFVGLYELQENGILLKQGFNNSKNDLYLTKKHHSIKINLFFEDFKSKMQMLLNNPHIEQTFTLDGKEALTQKKVIITYQPNCLSLNKTIKELTKVDFLGELESKLY